MKGKVCSLLLFLLSICHLALAEPPPEREITPSVGPYVKNGWDVFVTAEFLWWQAIQEQLTYAQSGVLVQPGTSSTSSGKVYKPDFSWDPGFRVGLGFYPGHNGWDLYANYTWLHSSSTDTASSGNGTLAPVVLIPSGLSNTSVSQITKARSQWDFHFNVIDLELGRNFYLSRSLAVRPYAGLKGTWQDQDWKTRYTAGQVVINNSAPLPGNVRTRQDQDVWGIGIRMGANGSWYFCKGWGLVTNIAFSGVWMDYDNDRKDTFRQNNTASATTVNVRKDNDSVKAVIEMMLGLRGEWWFQQERYHFALQAGWEAQVWINTGNFIYLYGSSQGDLSLNGLTVKARFDF